MSYAGAVWDLYAKLIKLSALYSFKFKVKKAHLVLIKKNKQVNGFLYIILYGPETIVGSFNRSNKKGSHSYLWIL